MDNCSISTTKILVKHTLITYHLHFENREDLPTSLDKDAEFLYRYINVTPFNQTLLKCDRVIERINVLREAYQEFKLTQQIFQKTKSPQLPKIPC